MIYSIVFQYRDGGSRGYVIRAEDRNLLMQKLMSMVNMNFILAVYIGEIIYDKDIII